MCTTDAFGDKRMNPENDIMSEINQAQKDNAYRIPHIWGI